MIRRMPAADVPTDVLHTWHPIVAQPFSTMLLAVYAIWRYRTLPHHPARCKCLPVNLILSGVPKSTTLRGVD